jgi:hypothetical protein
MNALEHIAFVLAHAVEADEVSKAEMLRILRELHDAAYEPGDTEAMHKLNDKLALRFQHVIHPDGVGPETQE